MKRMALGALLMATVISSAAVIAQSDKPAIPPALEAKIKDLPKAKREFLTSDPAEMFAGSYDKLFERLATKSPQEIDAYIEAMMDAVAASKFNAKTDMAAIPLDTDNENFNGWKLRRPSGLDPKREAGPFELSYYANGRGGGVYGGGIATFAGAPVAIFPEDLVAGKVDVAIVGAPLDMGSGYRGAKGGPSAMRTQYGAGGIDMYTMVDPSKELKIVDYGDIAIDNMSTERTVAHVRERVAEIARTGALPFIVGGDHSLEYSDVAGLADVHGKGSFGVVHFDSHYDAGISSPMARPSIARSRKAMSWVRITSRSACAAPGPKRKVSNGCATMACATMRCRRSRKMAGPRRWSAH